MRVPIRIDGERLRWLLPRLLALVVAACLPLVAYSTVAELSDSRLLVVESVDVVGNETVDTDELLAAAGFGRSRNMLTLDPSVIRNSLQAHPWVRTASVEIDLRDRAVTLTVEERTAAAIAVHHEPMLIDTHGEAIRPWRATDGLGYPVLVAGVGVEGPTPADLLALLEVTSMVEGTRLARRAPVVEVHDRGGRGFRVLLGDGFELLVARERTAERIGLLDDAMTLASRRGRLPTYALALASDPHRIVIGHDTAYSSATEPSR